MNLTLQYPPSINTYYRHVGHRVLISREGRAFRKNVCALLAGAGGNGGNGPRKPPAGGRIVLTMDAFPPDNRRRDMDNVAKPVLDALQHAGVYLDDSCIDVLLVRRRHVVPGGRLDVEIVDLPLHQCPLCNAAMN